MIDQNAAVSAGNIATAMQQVSASAQQAGLDIDTTMGYISTIADVSQRDPSTVGASLRTIISRYGTVKAGAFSGMGVDNTADDLENINDIEKVLRRLGISIRTDTMEFRALDDVLDDIADNWMKYSSVERNAIATAFAGTRQRESFLILMSNMDKARELTKVAAESQGMAELKYQAYLDSSEAATKRLQNAWEGLTNSFRTSDVLKGVKNTLAWFIEHLSTLVGLLGSVALSLKTMRSMSGFFMRRQASDNTFFGQIGTDMVSRVGGKFKNARDWAAGAGLENTVKRSESWLEKIFHKVSHIDQQETAEAAKTEQADIKAAKKPSRVTITDVKGKPVITNTKGKSIITDEKGHMRYARNGEATGQKITRQEAAAIMAESGKDVVRDPKGRFLVRDEMGIWRPVKQGGQLGAGRLVNRYADAKNRVNIYEAMEEPDRASFGRQTVDTAFIPTGGKKAAGLGEDGKWYYYKSDNKTLSKQAVSAEKSAELTNLHTQQNIAVQEADRKYKLAVAKYKEAGRTYDEDKKIVAKAEKRQANKEKAASAAAAGIAAGITTGLAAGAGFKDRDGEEASSEAKLAVGVSSAVVTGVSTGLLSLIPYVGPILGPTLGPVLGNLYSTYLAPMLGNLIDQEKISRRERSKDAEKSYNTIKAISGDTQTLKEMSEKGVWTFEDNQKATTAVNNIVKQLYESPQAGRALLKSYASNVKGGGAVSADLVGIDIDALSDLEVLNYAKNLLTTDYLNGNQTMRQQFMNAWEASQAAATLDQFQKSQEENYYQNQKIINSNTVARSVFRIDADTRKAIDAFEKEHEGALHRQNKKSVEFYGGVSERQNTMQALLKYLEGQGLNETTYYKLLSQEVIKISQATTNMNKSVEEQNDYLVTAAAQKLGINDLTETQIKERGWENIIGEVLTEINNQGGFFNADGYSRSSYLWTGALNTLAAVPQQYLKKFISNNSALYGAMSNQSYTLGEVLNGKLGDPNKQGTQGYDYILKFARSLNMTVEELNANLEIYSSFSLGDIMKNYSETKEAISTLSQIVSSMTSSTGLTADNMEIIISKFPDLIQYAGDYSTLTQEIYKKTLGLMDVQQSSFIDEIGSNTEFFKEWKESLGDIGKDINEITSLQGAENGTNFWTNFLNLSDEEKEKLGDNYDKIAKSFSDTYDGVLVKAAQDTTLLDTWRSYLSKIYELQIKNLEEQKSAMENLNSQREYENKLIEARNKLENAQNEKTAVYREGVGFVYEADQESILQAQEELEEVENERVIDRLDMMITELQSQKDWLDQFPERNAFKGLQQVADGIKTALGLEEGTVGGEVKKLFDLYAKQNTWATKGYTGVVGEANEKEIKSSEKSLIDSLNDLETLQVMEEKLFEARKTGNTTDLDNYLETIAADETRSETVRNAATSLQAKIGNNIAANGQAAQGALNETIRTVATNANSAAATLQNKYHKTTDIMDDNGQTLLSADKLNWAAGTKELAEGEKGIADYAQYNAGTSPQYKLTALEKEREKQHAFEGILKILAEDNEYINWENQSHWANYINTLSGEIEKLSANGYTVDLDTIKKLEDKINYVKNDIVVSKKKSGATTWKNLQSAIIKYFNEGDGKYYAHGISIDSILGRKEYIAAMKNAHFSPSEASGKVTGSVLGQQYNSHDGSTYNKYVSFDLIKQDGRVDHDYIDIKKFYNEIIGGLFADPQFIPVATSGADMSYATGSLSTSSGLSSISEIGPELFATPGLSGTALIPEGSKVIPAEATKGLWQFGNLAAQFIKPLQSMSGTSNTNNSMFSTDESTNIQTLNLTLRADKDFDINDFIQQLKALKAISKHN